MKMKSLASAVPEKIPQDYRHRPLKLGDYVLNLAFYPSDLRRLSEKILKGRMLPRSFRIVVNRVAHEIVADILYSQYQMLSSYRRPDEFQPIGA